MRFSERIAFKKNKILDRNTFEKFLQAARRIADFDPQSKVWVINWRKISSMDIEYLEQTLFELKQFTDIREEDIDLIIRIYREKLQAKDQNIVIDNKLNVYIPSYLKNKILNDYEIKKYLSIKFNKIFIKSIIYIKKLKFLAEKKYGISVKFDPDILTATIFRHNGKLYSKFYRIDKDLFKVLSEIGTLEYNEERVKLGPNKEYMGTELIPRKIRVFKVDWSNQLFETSVGFLERLISKLSEHGFSINNQIKELPDTKIHLKKNFNLYPHQEEALKLWLKKKRGTIAIFTRGGKSFIALGAVYELKKPVLILVPTRELVLTWKKYIEEYLGVPSSMIGVLGGGEQKIREITIAIYNSAVKYLDLLLGKFELVVFDEAHHVPANTFKEVALGIDSLYRMALSATPTRRDGNEKLLFALCGELIYQLTYEDLLKLKIVAPIEKFDALFAEGKEEKLKMLISLVSAYLDSKIIIFTQYLKTANEIYNELKKQGFKVELITGETPEIKREQAFKKFLDGRVNIIVTTTVLDEGITVPDADVAIIYESTGEGRQMIQRIGRVLGYHPGKTAKIFEIVDITDPREKSAYRRRSWVRELYRVKNMEEYVRAVKEGKEDTITSYFQRRIDSY